MKLYHLTTLSPTFRRAVAGGAFTAPRQQELVVATASSLELYRLVPKQSKLEFTFRVNIFANIVKLATFRLPATKRDFLVVTSDAGTLSILAANGTTRTFSRIHCETLGKTGMRRIVPYQFLASDPRGRACMVGALEKVKLCFVLNRDSEESLTISSALEANKSNTVTIAIVGIDVGFENPVFAALERSYDADATKQLAYYELDLGLNHITRRVSTTVRESTTTMIPVPGHHDGPGGVLLLSSRHVTYRNLIVGKGKISSLSCRLPYRRGTDPNDSLAVSSTLYHDKKRKAFFFMICTETGDLLKIDMRWNVEVGVTEIRAAYFDTLKAPATSMTIFRAGYFSVAMEGNDSALFRFESVDVGEDDPAGGWSVSNSSNVFDAPGLDKNKKGDEGSHLLTHQKQSRTQEIISALEFSPRSSLKNLSEAETHQALTPLLQVHFTRDFQGRPQLMAAAGRGKGGCLAILRRGISLADLASHVNLPFRAEHVFSFGERTDSRYHNCIVVSSRRQTTVLRITDGTIRESSDLGFEQSTPTVFAGAMSSRSLVQVHSNGVSFFPNGIVSDATEWKPPPNVSVVIGSGNKYQLIIALSSGTLVYFEVDEESGQLAEVNQLPHVVRKADSGNADVQASTNVAGKVSLSIQETPPGRIKASFFAASDGASNRVRLFRIGRKGALESLGLQIAPAPVCSVSIVDFGIAISPDFNGDSSNRELSDLTNQHLTNRDGYEPLICLVSGTSNGVATRAIIDSNTGDLLDKRSFFVGLEPVRTAAFRIQNLPICLVLSKESVLFRRQGRVIGALPLLTTRFHHATPLSSPSFGSGIVATTGSTLRFLAFDTSKMFAASAIHRSSLTTSNLPTTFNLDVSFDMKRISLMGTPRRIIPLVQGYSGKRNMERSLLKDNYPSKQAFVVLETDRTHQENGSRRSKETSDFESLQEEYTKTEARPRERTVWSSSVKVFRNTGRGHEDFLQSSVGSPRAIGRDVLCESDSITLPDRDRILDGVATAFGSTRGSSFEDAPYVVLSVARTQDAPGSYANQNDENTYSGYLLTYGVDSSTGKLSLLHETTLSEPAYSIISFRDMIAVGCGTSVELYALGKRKLLKKAECRRAVSNKVIAIVATGSDRVFIGDIRESVTLYRFLSDRQTDPLLGNGRFVRMASDSMPRWISSMISLDYSSVVCGDKFGNIVVLRLSKPRSPTTGGTLGRHLEHNDHAGFQGFNDVLVPEAYVHVGSTVTGLTLASSRVGALDGEDSSMNGTGAIIFATMDGSVGSLLPLRRQSEVHFAQTVESMVRAKHSSLCGRDHVSFRSSFGPVKNVIDGDLCEMFDRLRWESKVEIAQYVGRSVDDIVYDLEELRSSAMSS